MREHNQLKNIFSFELRGKSRVQKILMIDSDQLIAKQMGEVITSINHLSLGCVSNLRALETRIAFRKPDMIIINIDTRGDLDGFQLAKLLKLDYEIPFCILYDEKNRNAKKWADELNPDGLISYSNNYIQLVSQLRKVLN